jgi:hypothetical protein
VKEAVILASMDRPLEENEQHQLAKLLERSLDVNSAKVSPGKKTKRPSINFERLGRDFFTLYFKDEKDVSIAALSKILGVGGARKWCIKFQAWVEMWELPYVTKKGHIRVTPELLSVWFEREYNRRRPDK